MSISFSFVIRDVTRDIYKIFEGFTTCFSELYNFMGLSPFWKSREVTVWRRILWITRYILMHPVAKSSNRLQQQLHYKTSFSNLPALLPLLVPVKNWNCIIQQQLNCMWLRNLLLEFCQILYTTGMLCGRTAWLTFRKIVFVSAHKWFGIIWIPADLKNLTQSNYIYK